MWCSTFWTKAAEKKKIKNLQLRPTKPICSVFSQFVCHTCVSSLLFDLIKIFPPVVSYLLITISRFTSAPEAAYQDSPAFNKHPSWKVVLFQRIEVASGPNCSGNAFRALLLLFHPDYITNNHTGAGTAFLYFSKSVIITPFKSGFKTPWEQLLCPSCTIRGPEGHRDRWVNEQRIWWRRQMGSNGWIAVLLGALGWQPNLIRCSFLS